MSTIKGPFCRKCHMPGHAVSSEDYEKHPYMFDWLLFGGCPNYYPQGEKLEKFIKMIPELRIKLKTYEDSVAGS